MTTTTTLRQCTGCLKEQPLASFQRWNRGPGGYRHKCRTCCAEYPSATKHRPYDHTRVIKQYGITVEQYEAMRSAQNGQCAICKSTPSMNLAIDHDHDTGRVRGLLCRVCNAALGSFRDDPALLQSAISYLEEHQ